MKDALPPNRRLTALAKRVETQQSLVTCLTCMLRRRMARQAEFISRAVTTRLTSTK